jgi:hypothetical protein
MVQRFPERQPVGQPGQRIGIGHAPHLRSWRAMESRMRAKPRTSSPTSSSRVFSASGAW